MVKDLILHSVSKLYCAMRWDTVSIRALLIASLATVMGCAMESSHAGGAGVTSSAAHPYHLQTPLGFPEMTIPADNPLTEEGVALGKLLFFDPILSKDYTVSCASCHLPSHAFADTVAVSPGVHNDMRGKRNSPSLANVGYLRALFMEGGIPSLELQVLAPMGERSEMDLQIKDGVERIKQNPEYVDLANRAYGREIDPQVITWALASYQRTLISGNSPFDQYRYGGDEDAISESAKRGWQHFQALGCSGCHSGPLLSNQSYFNIGLYEEYADVGRNRLSDNPADVGKFRVPSLRNVAVTAPYMHDGSIATLDAVIEHFASGGRAHPNKSSMIRGFEISQKEKDDIIAFLTSLTDETFLNNTEHLPLSLGK